MDLHNVRNSLSRFASSLLFVAVCSALLFWPDSERNIRVAPSIVDIAPAEMDCQRLEAETDQQSEEFMLGALQDRLDGSSVTGQPRVPELADSLQDYASHCAAEAPGSAGTRGTPGQQG